MKNLDQIKAIAELDGWEIDADGFITVPHSDPKVSFPYAIYGHNLPRYLHSRDAIVPVIEKSFTTSNFRLFDYELAKVISGGQSFLLNSFVTLRCSPAQLCEALLHATGKWK